MKNNEKLLKFQIFSIIFAIILGTLLHFLFEWSGNNYIIGSFSAVNESTWEHLKLAFFPMFITLIIGYYIFSKTYPNFFCSKAIGIIIAISFIVVFFYTYTGIIGTNYAFLDISSFFIAVILGELISFKRIVNNKKCNKTILGLIIGILFICFILFTYIPPKINLFKDPINNTYGIQKIM